MAAIWRSPVGACEAWFLWPSLMLALCLSALFFSCCQFPVYLVLFHSSMLWWRRMVLHVLVEGSVVWGFRCYLNEKTVRWYMTSDGSNSLFQIRWMQVATWDNKMFIFSNQNATWKTWIVLNQKLFGTAVWPKSFNMHIYTQECTIWQLCSRVIHSFKVSKVSV